MQTEFEAKILDINVAGIISKLDSLGAKKKGEKFQKRYVYDFTPKNENSWIRLRTDGSTTTLTIKEIESNAIDGTKELEVAVDDFDATHQILQKLGYPAQGYQENKRISYTLNDVDVEIDSWPNIPTYLEIEGKSKAAVEKAIKLLGFTLDKTTSLNTIDIYLQYGIDISKNKTLKF